MYRVAAILVIGFVLGAANAAAQDLSRGSLSASVGLVQVPHATANVAGYAVYPELEWSRMLLEATDAGITVSGSLYAGGWMDDGMPEPQCRDCILYAYSSGIIGLRARARLEHFPIPLTFWGGFSEHVLWADARGGAGIDGNPGEDFRDAYTAVEAGAGFHVPLTGRWGMKIATHVHLPMVGSDARRYRARFATGIGIEYAL